LAAAIYLQNHYLNLGFHFCRPGRFNNNLAYGKLPSNKSRQGQPSKQFENRITGDAEIKITAFNFFLI